MTGSIFDRIGTLADRLRDRLGRAYGTCRTCGKPTRSHRVGGGVQCHVCHVDGEHVALADGGRPEDPVGRIERYVGNNPGASPMQVLAQLSLSPDEYRETVEAVLNGETPPEKGGCPNENPGGTTGEPASPDRDAADGGGQDPGTNRLSPSVSPRNLSGCLVRTTEQVTEDGESTEADRPAYLEAFADAVQFFHEQLDREIGDHTERGEHPDRPATARKYFEDVRGWDAETVNRRLLGYAPASDHALLDHLMKRGHDRDAILGTGLFTEDLRPLWCGRYVFPYFDGEGRPVYAISRATGREGGGRAGYDGHPGDGMSGKYAKPAHTKPYAHVEEPIYGLDSLEDGRPALITEGIADAVTAHERGYACLSPVTTQFKHRDRERLIDVLEDRDVPRVYVVQDAERPTSDVVDDRDGWDALTVEQFGPGVQGAAVTAGYLADHGTDAYLAELPRPGLDKVDLDDYLGEWADDLAPVLASAKPADQHPAYDPKDVAIGAATRDRADTPDGDDEQSGNGRRSALFDVGIRDVTGLSWDYRGASPLGHHGNSRNYFVLIEAHDVAYDFKYKAAYNALTYLLCDAGERDPAHPNGALDDREIFVAWKHAKATGVLPADDPIPHRALRYVALSRGLCDESDLTDGWRLPTDAYNDALAAVTDVHDVDPGRGPVGSGDGESAEHVPVLPNTPKARAAASGWDWRHAAESVHADESNDLSITSARERTTDAISQAYEHGDQVLIEALPTMGKSYGSIAAAAETDTPVTVLTTRGRKEQYGQLREWADDHGLEPYTLPSFTHDCPTANGEHGEEWRETVRDWYNRGATPKEIHQHAEYELGRPLPCQEHGTCPYASQWNFDPDDYDVLIGHYTHAHKQKVTTGRAVVFDEFPGGAYETELSVGLPGAVSYFLASHDAVPYDDYADLLENRSDDARRADALTWFLDRDVETDGLQVFGNQKGHAAAPLAVFTILAGAGDDLGNGWERADLGDGRVGLFDRENGRVCVLSPPPLQYTRAVVALDGTPTRSLWELSLGTRLNHRAVLSDDERREYIRDALNLNLIRTTDAVKPYNSADHVNPDQDAALLEGIRQQHGERPALITTATAKKAYATADLLEFDEGRLVDGMARDVQHYGNVLGSNQFAETRLGAVIGSNHYGDGFIKKWGAYAGEYVPGGKEARKRSGKGASLSYGDFGDQVLTHMREHETLQAAMRFGRDGNGATVYVHTDTLPDWVPLAGEGRVLTTWSDGMRQVIDVGRELGTWTTAEIATHPAVDVGRRQVFDHLETLRRRGYLSREQDTEDGRRYRWQNESLHRVGEHGDVELEPVDIADLGETEVQELARTTTYTWEFLKVRPLGSESAPPGDTPAPGDVVDGAPGATSDGPPPT